MTEHELDRELLARFRALRSLDHAEAPPLEDSWRAAERASASEASGASRRAAGWAALAGAVAVAVAAVVLFLPRTTDAPSIEDSIAKAKEISSWSAPTDPFLDLASLETSSGAVPRGASRSTR